MLSCIRNFSSWEALLLNNQLLWNVNKWLFCEAKRRKNRSVAKKTSSLNLFMSSFVLLMIHTVYQYRVTASFESKNTCFSFLISFLTVTNCLLCDKSRSRNSYCSFSFTLKLFFVTNSYIDDWKLTDVWTVEILNWELIILRGKTFPTYNYAKNFRTFCGRLLKIKVIS